jgi:hypothetical protein
MIADLRNTFRVSFIMSDAPMPIASASELLADVQLRPVWDGASISPLDADYLACICIGTKATDSSFSATRTRNRGATFL